MENKTLVHKCNVYEIGSPYLFSALGKSWTYDILRDIDSNYGKPFCTGSQEWLFIKEIPRVPEGTIKHAPLFLINGNAYMFDYDGRKVGQVGVYDEPSSRFYCPRGMLLLQLAQIYAK
jgi:hypothetical protein